MNRMERLYRAVQAYRGADPEASRTARLFAKGRAQIAKKLGEESVEVIVAYLKGSREGVIEESADLLYHLTMLWAELGLTPSDVWREMDRRAALTGLAGKLPKASVQRPQAKAA